MHHPTRKKGQKKWATMLKASSAAKAEVKKISSTSKAACTPLYRHCIITMIMTSMVVSYCMPFSLHNSGEEPVESPSEAPCTPLYVSMLHNLIQIIVDSISSCKVILSPYHHTRSYHRYTTSSCMAFW